MLIKLWGAEKVVECLRDMYPDADIFTLLYNEKAVGKIFPKRSIHKQCFSLASQRIYSILKKQRLCLPFMKRSIEKLDLRSYDLVIVSSSGFAHGCKTGENTKKIIYYHAPARYLWDWTHEYRKSIWMHRGIKWIMYGWYIKHLRLWDFWVSKYPAISLSNSKTTQDRIAKYYRKDSIVLYPPIETQRFQKLLTPANTEKIFQSIAHKTRPIVDRDSDNYSLMIQNIFSQKNYYIILSTLTEFKKIEIALETWKNIKDVELCIIGDGDYRAELECLASPNTHFLSAQYGDSLVALVQNSLWLIFPGEEDFGIVPIEVMAAGKPVFALRAWGLTESVIEWKSGEFFDIPDWSDFLVKFHTFHQNNLDWIYSSQNCKKQAQKYDLFHFQKNFKKNIEN